jgi:hypothetical protein
MYAFYFFVPVHSSRCIETNPSKVRILEITTYFRKGNLEKCVQRYEENFGEEIFQTITYNEMKY